MKLQAFSSVLALIAAATLPTAAQAQRLPYGAPITLEQAKKQRRELMQEIAREHRRKDREKLADPSTPLANAFS